MSEINEEEVQNNSENKNIKQQPQVVPVIDPRPPECRSTHSRCK